MDKQQVQQLLKSRRVPKSPDVMECIETHGAWVLLGPKWVYKIKRPVQFSFLDYSTLRKRKEACALELSLNQRFTTNIYQQVLPVKKDQKGLFIGHGQGVVVDYAVQMQRLDDQLEMDILLQQKKVTSAHITQLAHVIASFHHQATIIPKPFDAAQLMDQICDLRSISDLMAQEGFSNYSHSIEAVIQWAQAFIQQEAVRFQNRIHQGLVRDVHGDLHSRNVFLTDPPVLFDCIEFNEQYRMIDVLDEVAFLCMDLDFYEASDLANLLLQSYAYEFPEAYSEGDEMLFLFYKWYRASVRLKVTALSLPEDRFGKAFAQKKNELKQYNQLFQSYYRQLQTIPM